jgi:hypothetical protein
LKISDDDDEKEEGKANFRRSVMKEIKPFPIG